ncbi:MAG TPA: glycosyltransferase family 39 protein [Clostridia bacterium]|nr:glycosyltransferase family 39 protein [Clostridia bacterium]
MSRYVRFGNTLLTMMLAGFAVRIIVVACMYSMHLNPILDHWKFGWEMGRVARSLYAGQGFSSPLFEPSGSTAWMAPGYPLLLAAMFKLFGLFSTASIWAILTLNSIFGVVTIAAVYKIALRVFGEATAKIAGWTWAVFPYSIYLSAGRVWENTLTTMLMTLLFLLTLELEEKPTLGKWLGWGAMWGLGALVSPALTGALPFLGLWIAWRHQKRGVGWLPQAAVAALFFWALLSPWMLRNWETFHRFIPLRDNFWLELHVGNNGDTSDVTPDSSHPSNSIIERAEWNRLGELGYMEAKKHEVIGFIKAHPAFFAWVTVRRFVYTWTGFWTLDPKFLHEEPFHIPNVLFTTTLTLFLLLGLQRAWSNGYRESITPVLLLVIAFPFIYYLTHPSMDYRHPIDPMIVIMGGYAVVEWMERRAVVPREGEAVEELIATGD